jgi:nitrite reductase/ring-hydroxylating ferredoxin subunit
MMKYLYSILFILLIITGCGKDQGFIPDVPVNYNVTITEFSLKAVNNVLVVSNNGVGGLLIVKTPLGGYVAFDRCSTVNPEKICKVAPDDSGVTATDPCSGAKFSLLDGSPQKAPAERSLKEYNVSLQGNTLLHVSN